MRAVLTGSCLQRWSRARLRLPQITASWGPSNGCLPLESRRAYHPSIRLYDDAKPAQDSHSRASSEVQKATKTKHPPDRPPIDWDEDPNLSISAFSELPSANFGVNQHMIINAEFKEALRQILWQFRAPIRYAFAYGSGVFPQAANSGTGPSVHPHPSKAVTNVQGQGGKMIDFIFGVSYTEHWHSLNLHQHRDHYSAIGSLGSGLVTRVQDRWGAGVYFNPYITVNGTLIKYGVVNLDTLCTDLSEWTTLYLAGRLHKPVKILRDDPRVRLANQVNLISALRTALLLLPENFTEQELYTAITRISYMGDPRMALPTENRNKVANIVNYQLTNFRSLYGPLIENLPNVSFVDSRCNNRGWAADRTIDAKLQQDMDPFKRGNMVRRLPKAFRSRLYFRYQSKFGIPGREFNQMMDEAKDEDEKGIKRREGGKFERRMADDSANGLTTEVTEAIRKTIAWPATSQTVKNFFTSGISRSWRYLKEKQQKYKDGQRKGPETKEKNRAQETTGPPPGKDAEMTKKPE